GVRFTRDAFRNSAPLLRRAHLRACIFLVGEALERRHHLAREQLDVPFGQVARQRAELQQAEQILESKEAMSIHELLANRVGAAADDDALFDQAVYSVFLSGYRALVAAHVLERLGRQIAGWE